MSGQAVVRAEISDISVANPCVITTSEAHGLSTNNWIRITGLGNQMLPKRNFEPLNNNEYIVTVLDSTSFKMKDPVTMEYIDSTSWGPYVDGGTVTLEQTTFEYES